MTNTSIDGPDEVSVNENLSSALSQLSIGEETEAAVLGSCLIDREAITRVAPLLDSGDFSRPEYRVIYSAMQRLWERREPCDLITITDELSTTRPDGSRTDSESEAAIMETGISILTDLFAATDTSVHAEYYARRVKARRLIQLATFEAGRGNFRKAAEYEAEAERVLAGAEQQIIPIADMAERFLKWAANDRAAAIASGFPSLDHILGGGFHPGDLVIIGARPSIGKTALATTIFRSLIRSGRTAGFISLEMIEEAILSRLIAMDTGLGSYDIRKGDADWIVEEALAAYQETGSAIVRPPSNNLDVVLGLARELVFDHGAEAIFIDYLQYLTPAGDLPPYQATTVVSKALKELAYDTGVPIIVPAQLNRASEAANRAPKLSDLRESGQIEQDADIVLLLHRANDDDTIILGNGSGPDLTRDIQLIVAKNRNGAADRTIPLQMVRNSTQFREEYQPLKPQQGQKELSV